MRESISVKNMIISLAYGCNKLLISVLNFMSASNRNLSK